MGQANFIVLRLKRRGSPFNEVSTMEKKSQCNRSKLRDVTLKMPSLMLPWWLCYLRCCLLMKCCVFITLYMTLHTNAVKLWVCDDLSMRNVGDVRGHSGFSQTHNIGNNANIGIGGFTMWKKSSDKMLPPVGIEPQPLITSDSKSNTVLSTLNWHVLLRRSLNFCSCTTWYLDLSGLRGINRAWLYKEPKVSVLQANVKLV